MQYQKIAWLSIFASTLALAYSPWNLHLQGGFVWPSFQGSTQDIDMGFNTINQYTVQTPSQTNGWVGGGAGYEWNRAHHFSIRLDATIDEMRSAVSGVNTPFINGGSGFDTLNYTASGRSYALMFEPRITWTKFAYQPYFLVGLGPSFNQFRHYSETPTNPNGTAVPTSTPFNNKTTNSFAYEIGVGVQHAFSTKKYMPMVSVDYRFMDWGSTGLSTYTDQPVNNPLLFGDLISSSINLGLTWRMG